LVKPKWIRYEESWIGLTILLSVHICFYENQTRAWLFLTVISRRHSSKVHNIEEMILSMVDQYDVTQEWLDRVKIARKGLRKTRRRWRPSDGLWTEVLALSRWTNQLWRVIICWCISKVTWSHDLNSYKVIWYKSQFWFEFASKGETKMFVILMKQCHGEITHETPMTQGVCLIIFYLTWV